VTSVQCHLCGHWYRILSSSHLLHAHGISASDYRQLVGLRPRHPLQAPARSAAQADLMRRRIVAEPALRAAMAVGERLARSGELQPLARRALGERLPTLERERQLATAGSRMGTARAEAFRARREQQARALGFAGLEDFYRRRYRDQRAPMDDLAIELGCATSAVRGDLKRLRLGPDRARSDGARWR
jgi:ROS/MUCR transcriptional regulator protein